VALHVDGEYVCAVSEALVARWRLFKGRELDDADLAEVRTSASAERVMGDAYRLLGHRARSTAELRRRLLDKEHDETVVEDALERLVADGFLDDAAFARSYVADKRRLGGWGGERIRRGLRELGVESPIVDDVLAAGAGGEDEEFDRALAVLRRKGTPDKPAEAERRRAYQTLLRRGFSSSVAYAAVRRWADGDVPRAN
jgi:regulatory protein